MPTLSVTRIIPIGFATLAAFACGGSSDVTSTARVSVHATVYNGATPTGAGLDRAPQPANMSRVAVLTTSNMGNWLLSPDKMTVTITSLGLSNGSSTVADTSGSQTALNCPVTYDRSKPGLTVLGDCQFTVSPGTYTYLDVGMSGTYQVTIDDATNGFYSTSSGIVSSPPASGAQPYSVTLTSSAVNGEFHNIIPLANPVTITDTTNMTVSLVIDGIQFFHVSEDGTGAVTLGWPGTNYTDPFRPDVAASIGPLAKLEFYPNAAINTTGSYCASACGTGVNAPMGITSVAVYYTSPTAPSMVGLQLNGTPSNCGPFGAAFIADHRSYLGLDAGGNLGWAVPTTSSWTGYSAVLRMAEASNAGGSTTLYCQNVSSDPAPSGGSFASGAPNIATAGNSQGSFVLLAK